MLRLGTRTPGGHTYDLHQGDFVADERAVGGRGAGARGDARSGRSAGPASADPRRARRVGKRPA